MGRMARGIALTALAAATGCGEGEVAGSAADAPAGPRQAVREAGASPTGVADGEFVVSLVGGRVRLASREAPRLDILRRLADLEGFTLDTAALPEARVTLQLEETPLAAAVADLLDDVSYRSAWEYDRALGRTRLASLTVGGAASREAAGSGVGAEASLGRLQLKGFGAATEPPDEEQQRWIDALGSGNDRERREAVEEVDVEGPALARVIELATADPDPLVRAGAVERLEESGTFAAVQGLLKALEDPDPEVVLRTIEALEYAGDETIVPYLQGLYEHSDGRVREAAREAGGFLDF